MKVFIPENDYGIRPGYYTQRGIVKLLRDYCGQPAHIYFIADMLE
jgi:hypothetical protein